MCYMYTVYSGMQEWVIQIPSIPFLVLVLFPSLHLKYFITSTCSLRLRDTNKHKVFFVNSSTRLLQTNSVLLADGKHIPVCKHSTFHVPTCAQLELLLREDHSSRNFLVLNLEIELHVVYRANT